MFLREFKRFWRDKPNAEDRERRRWPQFLERQSVECAVWPTLFWDTRLCLTSERATNPARKSNMSRGTLERFLKGDLSDTSVSELDLVADCRVEGPPPGVGSHSTKRAFIALALSPDIRFGTVYEVLHFAYDLNLWSSLGAKRDMQSSTPMRVLLKGESFSPLYWRKPHLALLDAVRQRGYPPLFATQAPYEWSMPYHIALRDGMAKLLRPRQSMPLFETLHMAHVLEQTSWVLLAGNYVGKGTRSNSHQIMPAFNARGEDIDYYDFQRVEFQDGTHKKATQDYHGSGRPHTHLLRWGRAPVEWDMHKWASATMPPKTDLLMRGYVMGSQLDQNGDTPISVYEGDSCWDDEAQTYRLHHTAQDNALGLRAYVPALMEANPCHFDLQYTADGTAFRTYLVKYVPKFSDAATDDILDAGSDMRGNETAAAILRRYRPLEPEMVLQLFGTHFKQWRVSTASRGVREFQVPWPQKPTVTESVQKDLAAYVTAAWTGPSMNLLDFLRKSVDGGRADIAPWLKKKYVNYLHDEAFRLQDTGATQKNKFVRMLKQSHRGEQNVLSALVL